MTPGALTLTAINRYPVKSCRGAALTSAHVEPWGLEGDRRWMFVDSDGSAITARQVHRLLLVTPEPHTDGLTLTAPDTAPLTVRTPTGRDRTVDVFGSQVAAADAGESAARWVSDLVGQAARLVYLADPTGRRMNPRFAAADDRVSFADAYPLLLATEESLAALNVHIADGPRSAEGPLPMTRFRPNVVVSGAPAWDEDGWRQLRIGAVRFRAVKGCDRCVMTTLDPQTAAKGMEPITTLARHRKWDGKTWFGINLIPDNPGPIRVGDEVEVVSAVDPGAGPLR